MMDKFRLNLMELTLLVGNNLRREIENEGRITIVSDITVITDA